MRTLQGLDGIVSCSLCSFWLMFTSSPTTWSWAFLSSWSIYQKRTILNSFHQLLQHLEDEVVLSSAIHYSLKYIGGRWWHSTQMTASRFSLDMKSIAGEEANSLYTTTKQCSCKHSWAAGNRVKGMRSRVNLNLFIGKDTNESWCFINL